MELGEIRDAPGISPSAPLISFDAPVKDDVKGVLLTLIEHLLEQALAAAED